MTGPRSTLGSMFLITAGLVFGQTGSPPPVPAGAAEGPALCTLGSLPSDIQNRLKTEYGSWKVQEPANLSPRAYERWESEKPLHCPGVAVGQFENAKTPSYAVLLVRQGHANAGYKFIVFSPKAGQPSYEMRAVDSVIANLVVTNPIGIRRAANVVDYSAGSRVHSIGAEVRHVPFERRAHFRIGARPWIVRRERRAISSHHMRGHVCASVVRELTHGIWA